MPTTEEALNKEWLWLPVNTSLALSFMAIYKARLKMAHERGDESDEAMEAASNAAWEDVANLRQLEEWLRPTPREFRLLHREHERQFAALDAEREREAAVEAEAALAGGEAVTADAQHR